MYHLHNYKSLDPLLKDIGERRIAMLGEASHGTHEYYIWRTAITKRLIEEKQFNFIAVEGDWPDCYKINRYVKGYKDAGNDIEKVLKNFDRWPTWMWANWEVAALAEWMREYNKKLSPGKKVGFYGLDVYSLWDSMKAMMAYLENEDPEAARYVSKAVQCFEPFNENEHLYARSTLTDHRCRDEVLALLREIRLKAQFLDGDREAGFNTEQNALIAVNAEKYYSTMIGFDNESWNVRDRHMMETLNRLMQFHGAGAKGIVWEHNTHIGDARATNMSRNGMVNTGQLTREEYGEKNVYLCGFSCYKGSVIAGDEWGKPMQEMIVPEAKDTSIESILYNKNEGDSLLIFKDDASGQYDLVIPHRAIGVVYNPAMEYGNYVPSILSKRYDALMYFDKTKALHPLYLHPDKDKLPETYPFSF
jgi:erythromycin esterase-like protein